MDAIAQLIDDDVRRMLADGPIALAALLDGKEAHSDGVALRSLLEACYLVAAADGVISGEEQQAIGSTFATLTRDEVTIEMRERVRDGVLALIRDEGWEALLDRMRKGLTSPALRRLALVLAATLAAIDGLADEELGLVAALGRRLDIPDDEGVALIQNAIGLAPTPEPQGPARAGWYRAIIADEPPTGAALDAVIAAGFLAAGGRPTPFVLDTIVELGGAADRAGAEARAGAGATSINEIVPHLQTKNDRNAAYVFAFGAATDGGDPRVAAHLADALEMSILEGRRLAIAFIGHDRPQRKASVTARLDESRGIVATSFALLVPTRISPTQIDWIRFVLPRLGGEPPDADAIVTLHRKLGRDAALRTSIAVATRLLERLDEAGRRAAFIIALGMSAIGPSSDRRRADVLLAMTGVPDAEILAPVEEHLFESGFPALVAAREVVSALLGR